MTDIRWAGPPAAVDAGLAALGYPNGLIAPVLGVVVATHAVAGQEVRFALIRIDDAGTLDPPPGVFEDDTPITQAAVGNIMAGPRKPTPFEWLKSAGIKDQRRLEVFTAMRANPALAAVLDSILLLQEVDNRDPEITQTVPAVLAAGAITAEEAAALLA